MILFGNAKKDWEEEILNGEEDYYSPFFDTRYWIETDTDHEHIEIVNPIWTNIYEPDFQKRGIVSFQLNHIERIDIFIKNIVYIKIFKREIHEYDPIKKEITCIRNKE